MCSFKQGVVLSESRPFSSQKINPCDVVERQCASEEPEAEAVFTNSDISIRCTILADRGFRNLRRRSLSSSLNISREFLRGFISRANGNVLKDSLHRILPINRPQKL